MPERVALIIIIRTIITVNIDSRLSSFSQSLPSTLPASDVWASTMEDDGWPGTMQPLT